MRGCRPTQEGKREATERLKQVMRANYVGGPKHVILEDVRDPNEQCWAEYDDGRRTLYRLRRWYGQRIGSEVTFDHVTYHADDLSAAEFAAFIATDEYLQLLGR